MPAPNRFLLSALLCFLLAACSTISPFSEEAYKMATSLKVDSLALMDKATESYTAHQPEIDALLLELNKAHTYAQNRPKNTESTKQWEIMVSPDRFLIGGFLKKWKQEDQLSPVFIAEARATVASAFDQICELESGKQKTK